MLLTFHRTGDRESPVVPLEPVLVRTQGPEPHFHVCVFIAGWWRLSGAQQQIVHGVEAWADLAGSE